MLYTMHLGLRKHADEAIALLKERIHAGHAVDIQDLFFRFTLDSATEFLFGNCVHILRAGLPYSPNVAKPSSPSGNEIDGRASLFSEAFANAQLTTAQRSRYGYMWQVREFWKDRTEDDLKIVNAFIDPILNDAVTKQRSSAAKTADVTKIEEGETLLDHLINYTQGTLALL